MLRFSEFFAESKNVHMTHLEDSIIDNGVEGARSSINYLRALRDMLAGKSRSAVNVTTKWDGAPAVFAGIDPNDKKFFVAKKGIFNKNPKIYKTNADIDADTKGDLNTKMKLALEHLPKLGITGVIQGDFLFAQSDLQTMDIDGESHITFHPNTIVYAVPENSDLGRKIQSAKLGVVWHTTYRGDSFESMSASFGEEIASSLQTSRDVFAVDASYKDVAGSATFTKRETAAITKVLSQAGSAFNRVKRTTFEGISENPELNLRLNTFINSNIRKGQQIKNPKSFASEFMAYIKDIFQKQADKRKTQKGKVAQYAKRDSLLDFFNNTPQKEIEDLFVLYNLIVKAKLMIVKKLNKAQSIGTFLKTSDGLEATGQEGFVAIDKSGQNVVKLVDRLEFSRANFSPEYIKGWDK